MRANLVAVGLLTSLATFTANAGITHVALGTQMGGNLRISLGDVLGNVVGFSLGLGLPVAGVTLLAVAAASLVMGIRMVRRKQER